MLWFKSLDRIGPSRATLATNLQPFLAALFAVVLLGERINAIQVAGGLLIGVGHSRRATALAGLARRVKAASRSTLRR